MRTRPPASKPPSRPVFPWILAAALLAFARGLIAHPMAGFDTAGARSAFGLPESLRPLAIVAVGSLGDHTHADEAIVERDSRPRERLPLEQIVLNWPV